MNARPGHPIVERLQASTPTTLIQERTNLQLEVKPHLGVERREGATSLWGTRQMVTLQQHFSSMEETVRTLLQNQDSLEGPKVDLDPLDLMKAYKKKEMTCEVLWSSFCGAEPLPEPLRSAPVFQDKLLEEMWKQQDSLEAPAAPGARSPGSPVADGGSEETSEDSNPLLERLRALEVQSSTEGSELYWRLRALLEAQSSTEGSELYWRLRALLEAQSSTGGSELYWRFRALLEAQSSTGGSELYWRFRALLKAENSALSMENDNQRKQYERCLDEVANQVVQALLTQKDLKEECVKLRTRVFDLEQQNRILSLLFQQRVKMTSTPVSQENVGSVSL
ncbi:Nck-associated protein 5 [Takifugu flavidus]|uniref:Nck-associated protein 5 n=1 Tax=Takifugu flavidus TaxID=433684 RepID=A0A5C6PN07_9TELE|nr:Nck-associated protein 5 [Takifugu flavidus]